MILVNVDSGRTTDVMHLPGLHKSFRFCLSSQPSYKLRHHCISGSLLNWFSDYLNSRQQRIVVDGVSSSFLQVTSGVPQGSIVGLFLFIICVNDIPKEIISSKIPMFVDDSKCYSEIVIVLTMRNCSNKI